jgi:hypothetical protein
MSMSSLVSNLDSAPAQAAAEAAPKPKPKAPGRREILRRAEILVNRGHDGKEKEKEKEKPAGKSEPRRPSDLQNLLRRRSKDKPTKEAETNGKDEESVQEQTEEQEHAEEQDDAEEREGGSRENGENGEDGQGDRDRESSPPGSVHDSADDESDLSDAPGPVERVPSAPVNGWRSEAMDENGEGKEGE